MGHGQIISTDISAAEIEIDEAAHCVAQHQYIVREQVGMNDCVGQGGRPIDVVMSKLLGDTTRKARSNFVDMRSDREGSVEGKCVGVRVVSGGRSTIKKKK